MNFCSAIRRVFLLGVLIGFITTSFHALHAESSSPSETEETAEETTGRNPRPAEELFAEAREAHEAGRNRKALRLYRRLIRTHSTSPLAPESHFQSALIRLERKQWGPAFDHFQAIVEAHPDYPDFDEVIRAQYEIAEALRTGARLRLFWRLPGLRSPERAVEYFEQVVENAPYSELAPEAMMKAARLQSQRRKLDEAIDLYDRFISDYPDHEKASDAYFGLAEAFSTRVRGPEYDQGANREAISYYEDFTLLYPDHPRAPEAEVKVEEMQEILAQSRVVLGDFYFRRRNNLTAARVFYNEAITIAPVSPTADEAREKLAEVERRAEGL